MEKTKLPTGESLYRKHLPNGLTCFVLPKPGFLRTYAVLSTHYGSLTPSSGCPMGAPGMFRGIAHFLEHKLFEEEDGNAFQRFAAWGHR